MSENSSDLKLILLEWSRLNLVLGKQLLARKTPSVSRPGLRDLGSSFWFWCAGSDSSADLCAALLANKISSLPPNRRWVVKIGSQTHLPARVPVPVWCEAPGATLSAHHCHRFKNKLGFLRIMATILLNLLGIRLSQDPRAGCA